MQQRKSGHATISPAHYWIPLWRFRLAKTTENVADNWWWFVAYGGLVVGGMVSQFTDVDRRRETLREAWATGVTSTSAASADNA